jgi:hypothetical protein
MEAGYVLYMGLDSSRSLHPCSTASVALLIRMTKVENLTMTTGHKGITSLDSVGKEYFLAFYTGCAVRMTDLTQKQGLLNVRLDPSEARRKQPDGNDLI